MFNNMRTKFTVAMALSLFTAMAQAATVDVAENGGFESGNFSGWTTASVGGTLEVSMDNPASGSYSANLSPPSAPVSNQITQLRKGIGVVMPSQTVTVDFQARGRTFNGGAANARIFSENFVGAITSPTTVFFITGLNADPGVWTPFNFTHVVGTDVTGGVTLQLLAECGAVTGCLSDIYFDDVSITVQAVPVPAALWLFGSGLVGLVGIARRRKVA